jgi:uncharacterized membrane protein
MNLYLSLKCLHIVSSVLLVGTGFGTAFFMFFANRSGVPAAQAVVARLVVRADLWFTTPAGIVQPLTGFAMAHLAGWPLSTPWLAAALVLYAVAGACWLPVLWLQCRMAHTARQAVQQGQPLPATYWRQARQWEWLGYPAFIAMLLTFWLMASKPALGVGSLMQW